MYAWVFRTCSIIVTKPQPKTLYTQLKPSSAPSFLVLAHRSSKLIFGIRFKHFDKYYIKHASGIRLLMRVYYKKRSSGPYSYFLISYLFGSVVLTILPYLICITADESKVPYDTFHKVS